MSGLAEKIEITEDGKKVIVPRELWEEMLEALEDYGLLKAMEEAKVHVDPFLSVDEQVPTVVKSLRVILPISFESVKLRVMIPASFSGKGYNMVAQTGVIKTETWNPDGSWTGVVEVPASKRQELYDELNRLTKGQVRIEVER